MNSNEKDIFRRALTDPDGQKPLPADFQARIMRRIDTERRAREAFNERLMTVTVIAVAALFTGALTLIVSHFNLLDGVLEPVRWSMRKLADEFGSPMMTVVLPIAAMALFYALLLLVIDSRRTRRQLKRQ